MGDKLKTAFPPARERNFGLFKDLKLRCFAILLFGIFFIISNQIAGRILVPKYGTKLIMSLAFPLVTFSTFLAIISSSYFYFLLTFIPAGIGWGASGPI